VGRRTNFFVFLPGEDIDADKVDFRGAVLSWFGFRHFNDFAWSPLENGETTNSKIVALFGMLSRHCEKKMEGREEKKKTSEGTEKEG